MNRFVQKLIAGAAAVAIAVTGLVGAAAKFLGIFAVTQIPLAISEGLLTVLIFNALARYNARELQAMNLTTASEVRA